MISSVCAFDNITDDNITEVSQDNSADEINVMFDRQMWEENLSDIEVDLPESAQGNFTLKINSYEIYNQTITNKSFKIPVKLPKASFPYIIESVYPPRDCINYKVSAFYNNIELNINQPVLTVMKYSPDYDYQWRIPDEIIRHDSSMWNMLIFPRSSNGIVEIYVDDKLINKTGVKGPFVYYNPNEVTNLDLGNHTMRIVYYNDSYYHNSNKTFSFSVVNVKIDIPNTVYIGHDDCISVNVLKHSDDTIKVYIDNALVYTGCSDKDGGFILSLEKYLKFNNSKVKVEYISNNIKREKTVPINITYDFGYYDGYTPYIYGEENIIELILPDYLNNTLLSVKINGTEYIFTKPSQYMNNIVEIDVSGLNDGNYTVNITYPGDDRFSKRSEVHNFSVVYLPVYPDYIEFGDGSAVNLTLPSNAKGNLSVYINGLFYNTSKLSNGKTSVRISNLNPGEYNLTAVYDGEDYIVENKTTKIEIIPKITVDYFFTEGQNKFVKVNVPKDCKGYVVFYIDDEEYNVTIKNGVAKYSFKNLKSGKHIVYLEYYGDNGFTATDENLITIYKPTVKIVSSSIYTNKLNVKIKVTDHNKKTIKNVKVTFKINGKIIKTKTDSKGIALIKSSIKLKAKKYTVTVICKSAKVSKKIKVKHSLYLKSVQIRKSSKKLTLKAVLKGKGKTVTFKFNGKTFKAKTNSKGVAEVTVKSDILKKLPVGKSIEYKAIYQNDCVKKISKVKK